MASSCHDTEHPVLEARRVRKIAIAGNPNAGKTTIFNQLSGLRQQVGNYSGVTVERKSGRLIGHEGVEIIDLPGTYSLNPKSMDEQIAFDVICGHQQDEATPDLVVCVLDATNLERNLYLASQVIDLGVPVLVVLNMMDEVEAAGLSIDTEALARHLGAPVVPMVATRKQGLDLLRAHLTGSLPIPNPPDWSLAPDVYEAVNGLAEALAAACPDLSRHRRWAESLRVLNSDRLLEHWRTKAPNYFQAVLDARKALRGRQVAFEQAEVSGRYSWLRSVVLQVTQRKEDPSNQKTLSDRLDSVFAHRVAGPILLAAILMLVFQAIFSWATPVIDLIEAGMLALGNGVRQLLPPGILADLMVEGVIAGVGNVVVFLPQIVLLFFFLSLMESTGYMARTAFIMDRLMKKVGLSGGSVMPMMSGFACAVPAIMATRTIENQRDRLLTILIVPLISCSARLPVYTLFIAAFIPAEKVFGPVGWQGLTMFSLYILGIVMAFVASAVLNKILKGKQSVFVLELPPYRAPQWNHILWRMANRAFIFVTSAGKIIFFFSIVLWFAASFPKTTPDLERVAQRDALETALAATDDVAEVARLQESLHTIKVAEAAYQMEHSFIGQLGHIIEPVMKPLGFDWKLSAGVIAAFAAREVIIGALATIYSVGGDDDQGMALRDHLRQARDPETGALVYTPLVAVSLLVFFVLAMQCMSTLAVARRELNSWWWPVIMWIYMTGLAYLAALLVYQGGLLLGLG